MLPRFIGFVSSLTVLVIVCRALSVCASMPTSAQVTCRTQVRVCAHALSDDTHTDEYSHVHFESCSTSLRASFSRNYTHELRLLHHMRPTDATCPTHLDIFVHPRTCRRYTIHVNARPFAAVYATLQVNTFGARAVHVLTAAVLVGAFVALCATGVRAALAATVLVALLTWFGVGGVIEMKRCVHRLCSNSSRLAATTNASS